MSGQPPTDRQKEYARELGITFADDITRADISKLIDVAVITRDERRYLVLDELEQRESDAWQKMRTEVLAEIDAEDCRLSTATPSQMAEALSERGLAAFIIAMPWSEVEDFGNLNGVTATTSFADDMTIDDVEAVILTYAYEILKRKGVDMSAIVKRQG